MAKKHLLYIGLALVLIGLIMICYSTTSPPSGLIDKNHDGIVDWHDADLNGDGKVDTYDAIIMSNAMDTRRGDPKYNDRCDLNGDLKVDHFDSEIISQYITFSLMMLALSFNTGTMAGQLTIFGILLIAAGALVLMSRWRSSK